MIGYPRRASERVALSPEASENVSRPGAEGQLLDYSEPERSYESSVH